MTSLCRVVPLAGLLTLIAAAARGGEPATESGGASLPPGAVRQLGEVQILNVGRTLAVAFSPDGKTLAAGSWDETVRLWDVATGQEVRQLRGHEDSVSSVAFSRDGKRVLTGSADGTARLWDAATGRPVRVIGGPPRVFGPRLTPDGKRLVAGTEWKLGVWDVETGQLRYEVGGPRAEGPLGFTPDGRTIVVLSGRDGLWAIILRDAGTGKEQRWFTTGIQSLTSAALAPDARAVLCSDYQKLVLLNLASGRVRRSVPATRFRMHDSLTFAPSGKMFAMKTSPLSGDDEAIQVWETATFQERCRFRGPARGRVPLAFSPDGKVLASGSTDSTVLLWNVPGVRTGRVPAGKLSRQDLDTLWADLAGADAARAFRAMARMGQDAAATLPYLAGRLRPVTATVDPAILERLIADLGSDRFPVRRKAEDELKRHGPLAEAALQQALAKHPGLEVRRRLEQVLEHVDAQRRDLAPDDLRIVRTVELLEGIGGPSARGLLEAWAKGTPGALLTREAREALTR